MGNEFYHEFTVGLNVWMVLAPVVLVLVAILATQQFFLTPKRLRIRKLFGDGMLKFVAVTCGIMLAAMLSVESWRGILQWCDNSLAGDSEVYSLILAPICIVAVSVLYGVLIHTTMRVVAWTRLGHLVERRKTELKYRKMQMLEVILQVLQQEQILEVERRYQEETRRQVEEAAQAEAEVLKLWRPEIPVICYTFTDSERAS